MSVQILSLASGYLPLANNPIYTSPSTLTTIIKSIRLVNTDSVPRTVNIYLKRAAESPTPTNRYLTPVNLSIPAGGLYIDDQEITMSSGDQINYDTTATRIDFVISGIQR